MLSRDLGFCNYNVFDFFMIICLNGKFVDARKVKISPFDHGFLYGDGVYETMRTYKGKPWQIDLHLKRLQSSLKTAQIRLPWTMRELRQLVLKLIEKNHYPESRIRLMISRGESSTKGAVFHPESAQTSTLFITCYPLPVWQSESVATGKCVFFDVERSFPDVKTTSLFPLVLARMYADAQGAMDALLVDRNGNIYEGAVSNVLVVKRGVIVTPDANILKGTMRDFVLKLAKKFYPIEYRVLTKRDFFHADEVFLTNAPRGIIAVTDIEGRKIGERNVAAHLKQLFDQYIDEHF